ncbi:hypothetical protein FRC04_001035 [Tulasnella sp. 424]|nr:hypothetical protein FRC04_001035 [Tulasnella sp. 424]KAG8977943.1 hypothetical protein FRC05_000471 [Tulasnella sp. 425]
MRRQRLTRKNERDPNANAFFKPQDSTVRELRPQVDRKSPDRKRNDPNDSTPGQESSTRPDAKKPRLSSTAKTEEQCSQVREAQAHNQHVATAGYITDKSNPLPQRSLKPPDPKSLEDPPTSQLRSEIGIAHSSPHTCAVTNPSEATERNIVAPTCAPPDLKFVEFGRLQCVKDRTISIALRMHPYGSGGNNLKVGRDASCDISVSGPAVAKQHCMLRLELRQVENVPLRRRLWVKRIDPERSSLRTLVIKDGVCHQLRDSAVLSNGDRVQFGDGHWFEYQGPKFRDLYEPQAKVSGDHQTNSTVVRVKRLGDQLSFVEKAIPGDLVKMAKMAKTELSAFKTLGYHQNIVRFIEEFYDEHESIHHIILEAAQMDLYAYVSQMRSHEQAVLANQAPGMIAQTSKAIAHIHGYNMAHRDIKPQNLLVSVVGPGEVSLRVCDFGLARLNTQPVPNEEWRVGTKHWMAPGSFMSYPEDDRLVDCYGIGRVLYFVLTSSRWPPESRKAHATVVTKAGAGEKCLDFLKNLLVELPEECMAISEILEHPYIVNDLSTLPEE